MLIVTADDLGLTEGVCHAIEIASRDGILTATSLLANGRAFDTAVTLLRANPRLELGAHLALVGEDPPLLSAAEVPTLVDNRGAFPLSYRTVVARAASGRLDPADVRREFGAQLERVQRVGVPVTHLDTHQHTHLWPSIGRVVLDLAVEHGVPAVRAPRSHRVSPVGFGVNVLARRLRAEIARRGLATTDDYRGLDEAGRLDGQRFASTLSDAGSGVGGGAVEINMHPGVAGDTDLGRFDWGFRWADELSMLTALSTREAVAAAGFRLGGFADLTPARRSR